MSRFYIIAVILCLAACSEQEWNKIGGLKYKGVLSECPKEGVSHYLLDLQLKDYQDSIILYTHALGRKLEIPKSRMDSNSSLSHLISKMCPGDSIKAVLDLDSFYLALGGQRPANLKQGVGHLSLSLSDALTELKYEAHKRVFEQQTIERYLNKFRWDALYDTSTGIYFEYLKSSRSTALPFNKAKIAYVIKGLNEELIEYSKENEPLLYDKEDRALLKGMHFLASQLQAGEKLRAIMPSAMAYGNKGKGRVPPYFPLVVEMELIKILE